MKLLRFELASAPGYTRSGIVHGGKVYETDGEKAIGVHEWSDVVPFLPTGQPPSYRMFRLGDEDEVWLRDEKSRPGYFYLNPATLIPPNRALSMPLFTDDLGYEPQLCAVIATGGAGIGVEEADAFILGLTVANTFVARDLARGDSSARARDFSTALGPFLTTPEELDDVVIDDSRGRRYRLDAVIRVNGEEVGRENLGELPYTFAELASYASETCGLQPGDLIGMGPIGLAGSKRLHLEAGDEVHVNVERLGALVTRIT